MQIRKHFLIHVNNRKLDGSVRYSLQRSCCLPCTLFSIWMKPPLSYGLFCFPLQCKSSLPTQTVWDKSMSLLPLQDYDVSMLSFYALKTASNLWHASNTFYSSHLTHGHGWKRSCISPLHLHQAWLSIEPEYFMPGEPGRAILSLNNRRDGAMPSKTSSIGSFWESFHLIEQSRWEVCYFFHWHIMKWSSSERHRSNNHMLAVAGIFLEYKKKPSAHRSSQKKPMFTLLAGTENLN
jgi:hypothetical protein